MKRSSAAAFDSDEQPEDEEEVIKEEEESEHEEEEESKDVVPLSKALVNENSPFFKYLSKFPDKKFRFITTQCGPLATMGACFASLFDTMRLQISSEGIVGTCLNGSRTVMVRWVLMANEMVEGLFFPPNSVQEIMIDVPQFANDLAAVSKSDVICISLDNDDDPMKIIIDSNEEEVTGCLEMQLNIPEKHLEIPPLEYMNRVVLTSDDFNRKLHLKTDAKRVTFDLNKEKFSLTLKSTRNKMTFAWPVNSENDIMNEEVQKRIVTPQDFMLSAILNVARITKATKYVNISMPERRDTSDSITSAKPLLISYQLVVGTVSFFIAPCLEDEDD